MQSLNYREMCDEFDVKLHDVEEAWKRNFAECHFFDKGMLLLLDPSFRLTYISLDPVDREVYQFRCSLLP